MGDLIHKIIDSKIFLRMAAGISAFLFIVTGTAFGVTWWFQNGQIKDLQQEVTSLEGRLASGDGSKEDQSEEISDSTSSSASTEEDQPCPELSPEEFSEIYKNGAVSLRFGDDAVIGLYYESEELCEVELFSYARLDLNHYAERQIVIPEVSNLEDSNIYFIDTEADKHGIWKVNPGKDYSKKELVYELDLVEKEGEEFEGPSLYMPEDRSFAIVQVSGPPWGCTSTEIDCEASYNAWLESVKANKRIGIYYIDLEKESTKNISDKITPYVDIYSLYSISILPSGQVLITDDVGPGEFVEIVYNPADGSVTEL